jgi:hypothetical protein
VGCGCVEFCLVWTPLFVVTMAHFNAGLLFDRPIHCQTTFFVLVVCKWRCSVTFAINLWPAERHVFIFLTCNHKLQLRPLVLYAKRDKHPRPNSSVLRYLVKFCGFIPFRFTVSSLFCGTAVSTVGARNTRLRPLSISIQGEA